FFEVFQRWEKHSETFALLASQMFVVHFMSSTYAAGVPIVRVSEHFEPLVYKNIVDKKIGNTIGKNTQPNGQSSQKSKIAPANKTADAYKGVKKKKIIVALPPTPVILVMVVFV